MLAPLPVLVPLVPLLLAPLDAPLVFEVIPLEDAIELVPLVDVDVLVPVAVSEYTLACDATADDAIETA